jgi:hypothetical protein
MTEPVAPMLPRLAIMVAARLFMNYLPESFMRLPRVVGFAP